MHDVKRQHDHRRVGREADQRERDDRAHDVVRRCRRNAVLVAIFVWRRQRRHGRDRRRRLGRRVLHRVIAQMPLRLLHARDDRRARGEARRGEQEQPVEARGGKHERADCRAEDPRRGENRAQRRAGERTFGIVRRGQCGPAERKDERQRRAAEADEHDADHQQQPVVTHDAQAQITERGGHERRQQQRPVAPARIAPAARQRAGQHAARRDQRHEETQPERRHAGTFDAEERQIRGSKRHRHTEHQRRGRQRREARNAQQFEEA